MSGENPISQKLFSIFLCVPSSAWNRRITKWEADITDYNSELECFKKGKESTFPSFCSLVSFSLRHLGHHCHHHPNRLNPRLFSKFPQTLPFFLQLGRKTKPPTSSNQEVWMVVWGPETAKITLWASTSWPSAQARVTSENSLLSTNSSKEELPFLNCGILLVMTGVLYVVHRQQLFQTFRIYANILYFCV